MLTLAETDVKNTQTQESVPRDGKTMGEIVIKGSSVMKGYLKDPKATLEAFKYGWLNTGDIGVIHPDGHIEIKDRSKDIIISGGENISSVEVEQALTSHPAVLEVAVVAGPDEKWGEVPVAFVTLKEGVAAPTNDGLPVGINPGAAASPIVFVPAGSARSLCAAWAMSCADDTRMPLCAVSNAS